MVCTDNNIRKGYFHMKKLLALSTAVLLVLTMMMSLVACSGDTTIDEEESTTQFVRMDMIPEEEVVSYINTVIEKTNAAAPQINVSEGFDVSDTLALTAEDYALYLAGEERLGNETLDKLDDTLGFIKTYLMNGFSAPLPEITSVVAIDNADVAQIVNYDIYTARNWTSENIVDEEGESIAYEEEATKYRFDMDGNELTDEPITNEDGDVEVYEPGDVMSKSYVCDNKLNVTLSFSAPQSEDELAQAFVDSEIINKYFPNTIDKQYILSELAKVATAVSISDYTVQYRDCTIYFSLDMETEQLLAMNMTRNALITMDAQGQGSFADLGEFKLCFNFRDTINCSFDYSVEAAGEEETNPDTLESTEIATETDDTEIAAENETSVVDEAATEIETIADVATEIVSESTAEASEEAVSDPTVETVPEITVDAMEETVVATSAAAEPEITTAA